MPAKKLDPRAIKGKGYQRNFLKGVLLRLDFSKVSLNFLERFYADIQTEFPFQSKEDLKTTVWTFYNANKTKKLEVSFDNIVIEYQKYSDKEELIKDVNALVLKFIDHAKIETVNRLGLRYINEINLNDIRKNFSWEKYISADLLGMLKFVEKDKGSKLARAIGKVVLKKEKADVGFIFGIFNSDFPNESLRKEFTLDYDCYSLFPISPQEQNILEIVKIYNGYIENLFESSITDDLRKVLKKKND